MLITRGFAIMCLVLAGALAVWDFSPPTNLFLQCLGIFNVILALYLVYRVFKKKGADNA